MKIKYQIITSNEWLSILSGLGYQETVCVVLLTLHPSIQIYIDEWMIKVTELWEGGSELSCQ